MNSWQWAYFVISYVVEALGDLHRDQSVIVCGMSECYCCTLHVCQQFIWPCFLCGHWLQETSIEAVADYFIAEGQPCLARNSMGTAGPRALGSTVRELQISRRLSLGGKSKGGCSLSQLRCTVPIEAVLQCRVFLEQVEQHLLKQRTIPRQMQRTSGRATTMARKVVNCLFFGSLRLSNDNSDFASCCLHCSYADSSCRKIMLLPFGISKSVDVCDSPI